MFLKGNTSWGSAGGEEWSTLWKGVMMRKCGQRATGYVAERREGSEGVAAAAAAAAGAQ